MIIIRNCKFSENPRRIPLHVHLQCTGPRRIPTVCSSALPWAVPDNARGSAGLYIAPAGAEVTNVAGVASFLSGSILPRGASSKFHANRHIELTGPDQTTEGFGPGGRVWRTGLEDGSAEWACGMEPSTISGFSVDGSALDIEPSMMQGVFVDGSGLENGTVRDMGH